MIRPRLWFLLFFVSTLAAPFRASADNIETFSVTGSFTGVGGVHVTFSPGSTVTIDTTTGLETANTLMLSTGDDFTGAFNLQNLTNSYAWQIASSGNSLQLFYNSGFVGFGGGTITSSQYQVIESLGPPTTVVDFLSSDTTLTLSAVPEPSSVLLLGTGMLAARLFRRRLRQISNSSL